ncbi:sigma-70 family RNA polymerase sigma factor [Streptomyces bugieae]|uniref:Sigma-70 family RNA polymerase sigma factor n=1 Tax=Streptomyces bugieae TaxID=3098223 RepID=A0ABU7P2W0_9ACTN|nr:sigma-70 family RNA polymerase sigma factor [Streptomyces sp. DSM 41528]
MGVDGRDERRDGETGPGGSGTAPSPQVPGQAGPLGATPPTGGPAGRQARAGGPAGEGPSVPPQRDGAGRATPHGGPGDVRDAARGAGDEDQLPPSDDQLIAGMRAGDDSAYEEMYRRHADAVRRHARHCCRDEHTAEDLTGEVFARTLQAVRGGAGPTTAVRAYLLTTVRRVAASWAKTARREQLVEDFAVFAVSAAGAALDDGTLDLGADVRAMHEAERSMAVQAFRSLPERYQTVLWHTTVEDESPSEVAPLLGLTANATAVLAHRAREGLKQAYLQAHVSQSLTAGGDCARYADRLGAYARGGLRMRAERGLREHLDGCARCRTAALEVEHVNERIGAVLPVAVIGWFAAGYAVKTAAAVAGVAGAAGAGAAAAATGGSGTAGGAGGAGGAALSEGLGAPVKVGIGVGVVVAGVTLALALAGGGPTPAPHPRAEPHRPAPAAPRHPSPGPAKPLPPAAGTAPTAEPTPSHPSHPSHPSAPHPTPSRPAPTTPRPTPHPPAPTPPPTPAPEPTRHRPKPPEPAPTPYQVAALDHDFMGDGSKPEVRTLGSGWLWQRRSPKIAGTTYAHGATMHAGSSVLIDLNRPCTSYDAVVGVDDLSMGIGALRFSVYADGERLWRSAVVHGDQPAVPVHVPLTGHRTLRLVVDPATPLDAVALGDWAEARITCR